MQPHDESRAYIWPALRHVAVEDRRNLGCRDREDGCESELSGGRAGYAGNGTLRFGVERSATWRLVVSRSLRRPDVEPAEIRRRRRSETRLQCRGRNPHDGGGRGLLRIERQRRNPDTIDRLVILAEVETDGFRPRRFFI